MIASSVSLPHAENDMDNQNRRKIPKIQEPPCVFAFVFFLFVFNLFYVLLAAIEYRIIYESPATKTDAE